MNIIETNIPDVLVFEPNVFRDARGYFLESFSEQKMNLGVDFVQDNESMSGKGVLRGLHFQNPPYEQGKLVKVVKGGVLDVAVDIRKASPWYGQHVVHELTEENKHMMWIPPGFAHGFVTLEDNTIFQYKCTNYYNKASEGSIKWDDPSLNIDWKISQPELSEKDLLAPSFEGFASLF